MGVLDEMTVFLGADFRALVQGLNGATAEVSKTSKRINNILDGMNQAFAALGVTLSISALGSFIKSAANSAEAMVDMAKTVGITTDRLQELYYVASENDIQIGQMDDALLQFTKNVGDAVNGTGPLVDTFTRLNIGLYNADGTVRSINDVFIEFIDKMSRAGSQADKLSIAADGFGKSAGPGMVKAFDDGAASMEEFARQAHEASLVIDNETLQSAKEINEQFDRMANTLSVTLKKAALESIVYFKDMATAAAEVLPLTQSSSLAAEIGHRLANPISTQPKVFTQAEIDKFHADVAAANPEVYATPYEDGPYATPINYDTPAARPTVQRTRATISHQAQQIRQTAQLSSEYKKLNANLGQHVYVMDQVNQKTIDMASNAMSLQDTMSSFGQQLGSAFASAATGADNLGDSILRIIANLASSQLENSLSSSLGSVGTSIFSSLFGKSKVGTRASGGSVMSGMPYLVGERGIELFQPNTSGRIVTNSVLRSAQSSSPAGVTVNQNNYFSAGVSRAELASMLPAIKQQAIDAVVDARDRGAI